MKRFQITEDDLAELERLCPLLQDFAMPLLAQSAEAGPKVRTTIRRVKEILSNVRWDYGPFSNVAIVPAGDEP